ncbi:MAG: TlpA family protein disulfide reductase [candidate division Zixibacteria bacterium]|nr:TlpA family protein disulfide reductase [candidate division Zixibacteria bacterium]
MRKSILVLIFTIMMVASAHANQAYDFTLKDIDGNTVRLSDFKGKVILLDFWATWCGPCRVSLPFMVEQHGKYGDKGFVMIGINLDQRKSGKQIQEFLDSYGIEYLNVIGDKNISRKYRVTGIPLTVLIDQNFDVVRRYVGLRPESKIELGNKIAKLVAPENYSVGICLDFFKVIGDNMDTSLGDRARRLIYKSLIQDNINFKVDFIVPGENSSLTCEYKVEGVLSVNGNKGRLTAKLFDASTGREMKSASAFGEIDDLTTIASKAAIQLSEIILRQ